MKNKYKHIGFVVGNKIRWRRNLDGNQRPNSFTQGEFSDIVKGLHYWFGSPDGNNCHIQVIQNIKTGEIKFFEGNKNKKGAIELDKDEMLFKLL